MLSESELSICVCLSVYVSTCVCSTEAIQIKGYHSMYRVDKHEYA